MIENFIASLGANALVLGALTYLLRSLIGNRLNKDVEEFKHTLELKTQHEIESYKAQIEKDRLRLQISYGGIFEKQAGAILELYKNILALEGAASDAVYFGGSAPERKEAFHKAWAKIRNSYNEDRILLPRHIDEMVGQFMDRMRRCVFEIANIDSRGFARTTEEEFERLSAKQDKAYEIIETDLPALREKLIISMRQTVGTGSQEI